ncbi:fumarylacetoacetate hydrolase family protein [Pararhizobium sp. YC-54]|uniref:fumarylacetoacetate hydrolase family protein n=1 Tax=Pararhizobium sp. YC-54 TaxID=2986920 RepID=UPI0021F73F2A|nr:fumarylacetoacetate hydrolase family protein [Pararhizobium sp. YC-54]MCV9999797.1 fumarylacetoacetate hydrolase family protein [Pararhizobium sp. YC-54]
MKLATLKDSTRDGKLVVVSKDLTRCSEVGHIARTLQAALDDWAHVGPRLARVALGVETGAQPTIRFHEHDAASPLPRAFFWAGGSGGFTGPRDSISVKDGAPGILMTTQLAVIVDDVDAQAGADEARQAILLVLLANDVSADGAVVASSFSPVAVTPDELGEGADLSLLARRNGKPIDGGKGSAKESAGAVAVAAGARPLVAGSIVATGLCLVTSALSSGDVVRIEANDRSGHSIFGAIEQTVETSRK